MSTVITVEAFNRNIQKHKSHLQATKSGFLPLYNWQQDAYKLKDYQTVLFNTPTASGKSVLMRAIAADEHINHNRKVIIVVPAQELAKEFEDVEENRLRWQSGKTQIPEFTVTHPLYTEKIQGRIKTVKEFLKSADSGILVACNQTIIGAFSHLNKKYLDNLCILVDEAHHSSSQSYEDDDESEALSDEVNELGRVVRKCYENDVVLRFFTATFYRDDRKSVVPPDIMETTKVYDMKLHDFLQDSQLTEVENISCDIRFAKGNSNEKGGHHFALKSIWDANPDLKTAVWLSNPNKFNKVYQTECAIETLGKPIVSKAKLKRMGVTDEELEAAQGTVIYLDHKGVLKRVVELSLQSVDECTPKILKWYRGSVCERNDRENYFNKVKNEHIDACIYLNKGQEGTNWRALERAVIYEQRKLGRATQMIGRVLRKWSGKKDVCVHFVLPQMLCTTLNEDAKDKINEYVNTLWASMIIDNIIEPLFLRAKRQGGGSAPVARDQGEFDSVFALRSDEGVYLRNCAELIDQWYEGCADKPNGRDIRKKFGEIVEAQLKSLKIEPTDVQKFVRATWQRLVVKKQEIQGQNIVIDYNMIMNEDTPVGCAKVFYGTTMTKEFSVSYKKYLDTIRSERKTLEEHINRAIELGSTSSNGTWKYRGNGYYSLPQNHLGRDFWKKVRKLQGIHGKYDGKCTEEEHIVRAIELKATCGNHENWKQRGHEYYGIPERKFANFWENVRNKLGVTGLFDEKHTEEEHIVHAVELQATNSGHEKWKQREDGYYALPDHYFDNFWENVRDRLGTISQMSKYGENEHFQRAIKLKATSNNSQNWKNRGSGFYAHPEQHFDNFWENVRLKLGYNSHLDKKKNEYEHFIRAIELQATNSGHENWKQRGHEYYCFPEQYFDNFWQKVRDKLGHSSWIDEKENEECHIKKAVGIKATCKNSKQWKNRGKGFYHDPHLHFENFWQKVREAIKENENE